MCDRSLLEQGLKNLEIRVNPKGEDNIILFCHELQKWNKKINLIARNTPAEVIIEKHFLDSLTLLPVVARADCLQGSLLDVGTGAGFPGLVLAAVLENLAVTLVEPRKKRVTFLRHIVRTLQLNNVTILSKRLEQAGLDAGWFDCITSRAVVDIDRFLPMVEPLCTGNTQVIVMGSTKTKLQNTTNWQRKWQIVDSLSCKLPMSGVPRLLIVLRKRS